MTNNSAVVDLNKVQFATFYYKNQQGQVSRLYKKYSVNNVRFNPDAQAYGHEPGVTMLEIAQSLDILDRWTPVCRLQLTANHWLKYTGDKAVSIWKEWRRKIFNKTRKG